jgi:hypothetical protein
MPTEGQREIAWALAVLDERQRRQLATIHTRLLNEQGRELNMYAERAGRGLTVGLLGLLLLLPLIAGGQ